MPRKRKEDVIEETINTDDFKIESIDGIGPVKSKALHNAGVETAIDILIRGSQELTQITGMKKEEAQKLVEKVRLQLISEGKIPDLSNAKKYWDYRQKAKYFKTGSEALNKLLEGGIVTQAITEIYGPEGAGKTQFLHTLVALALKDGVSVYFIDCEGTFDVDRIMNIAEIRGLIDDSNKDTFLDKLLYDLALDTDSIERVINTCVPRILENKVQLIVIDGVIGKYRLEYDQGRSELNARQNDIKPLLKHLTNMAEFLDLAVIVTNQVMGNPDGGYGGEPDKPIGGHIVGHNCRYIVRFNKGARTKRIAKFIKSNRHAPSEELFYVNTEGISDYDEDSWVTELKRRTKDLSELKKTPAELPPSEDAIYPRESELIDKNPLQQ